jgi:hypothetical protein
MLAEDSTDAAADEVPADALLMRGLRPPGLSDLPVACGTGTGLPD